MYALIFYGFAQEANLYFLIPNICIELRCFHLWNYFAIINSLYLHWALMVSLKKLFNNFQYPNIYWALMVSLKDLFNYFQYPIYGLSFDRFAQKIIWSFPIPKHTLRYDGFINNQYIHWALMISLKHLFNYFQYPIYGLSFNGFAQEIIL